MNERIKTVRVKEGMSMRAFAAKIGISSAAVSHLETGINTPSEQTIRAICSEFNVNREWLETGQGQPYKENALIPELVRVLRSYPALYATLERIMPAMTDAEWQALDAFLDRIRQGQL